MSNPSNQYPQSPNLHPLYPASGMQPNFSGYGQQDMHNSVRAAPKLDTCVIDMDRLMSGIAQEEVYDYKTYFTEPSQNQAPAPPLPSSMPMPTEPAYHSSKKSTPYPSATQNQVYWEQPTVSVATDNSKPDNPDQPYYTQSREYGGNE
eukprot:Nk52_evm27s914 gene=Nk52_evmTU27s914